MRKNFLAFLSLQGRRWLFALVATATLLLGAGFEANAQDDPETEPEVPAAPSQPARPRDEEINLLRLLNLTPEQIGQLRAVRQESEREGRGLGRRLNQARRALDEAIYADSLNEELIRERAREVVAAQMEVFRLRTQTEVKVRRVLTPEQLQRFRVLRSEAQAQRQRERRNRQRQQQGNALDDRRNRRMGTTPENSNNPRPAINPRQRRRNALGHP